MKIISGINKIDELISNRIRVIIGILLIAAAVIIDTVSGYSDGYNGIVTIIVAAGLLSIVNILFGRMYNNRIPYVLYMAGNLIGMLLYLYVISRYNIMGGIYTVLFFFLVFLAMWIMEMCLTAGETPKKRILGGLVVNIIILLLMAVSAILVATLSVIVSFN